jgi:uncharacterized membrane protein YdbT with pleckstrin-like domain
MASDPAPPLLPSSEPPVLAGRLHPLTLFFRIWHLLRGLLIPLLLFLFIGREWRGTGLLIVVLAWRLASVIRYSRLGIGLKEAN